MAILGMGAQRFWLLKAHVNADQMNQQPRVSEDALRDSRKLISKFILLDAEAERRILEYEADPGANDAVKKELQEYRNVK